MKLIYSILLTCLVSFSSAAEEVNQELKQLAEDYFQVMVASQAPSATKKELEAYLALLTDDVGHQHLPYVVDDRRLPDGKESMRKGMMYYLGAHTEYQAKLLNTFIFNDSAIAIRYQHSAKGVHPDNNQAIAYTSVIMEVLEVEEGKVARIRKYHE